MVRLARRDQQALLEFLRESHALRNLDAFPAWVIQALPRVVSCEHISYNEINPRSRRIVWKIEPAEVEFPGARQLFERHMHEHPLITRYSRTREGRARKISDFLTRSQFHRLDLYNEYFRRIDVEYQMGVTLPAPPPLVVGFGLNRNRRDFSERDRSILDMLRSHLIQTYRNAESVTRIERELAFLRQGMEEVSHGVVILTQEGRVRLMTERARQWLGNYFGATFWLASHLPEAIQRWVRDQEASLDSEDDVPPPREPLVVEREGRRLVVRLFSDPAQSFLLMEEQQTALQPASLEALGLTRREAEVLAWVAQGKTNAEIGTTLGTSPRTIQKHLERIFIKLGVETRTAAAVHALAATSPAGS